MSKVIQPSFAKGEISPELWGRIDTSAYALGVALAKNTIVHTYGGISRRPGTRYIAPVADHSYAPRLIEFRFKTTDEYVLEFGNEYIRVIRDGGHVLEDAKDITGATNAKPIVVTAEEHGFVDGDEVYIDGVKGMTELNQRRFYIVNATEDTFELTHQVDGSDIDGTDWGVYTSGGTVARIYEIESPYTIDDVFQINYTQSADVMTLVHKNYPIYELSRNDHDDWSLTELSVLPTIPAPTDLSATSKGSAASVKYKYKVTATDRDTGEESLAALSKTAKTITGATQANPVVITATAHGLDDDDEIFIDSVGGMAEVNGRRFIVRNSETNKFELYNHAGDPVDGTNYGAYVSGGSIWPTFASLANGAATSDNEVTWEAVSNASRYTIYRLHQGVYAYVGDSETTSFADKNILPDTSQGPPVYRNPFELEDDWPSAVGYFEQRRVVGGSYNKPDTSEYSQTGASNNFSKSFPLQDTDAITATLNSREVNEIRHYVALNDLLILTSGSEWKVSGSPDQGFTPNTIRQKPQSTFGSSYTRPVTIANTVLFVTEDKSNVRTIGYSLDIDGYKGSNLTRLSRHLLDGRTIVDWAYSAYPESRIYLVRDDGVSLALSFDPEQELVAWTWFNTSGKFEAVQVLRSGLGNQDTVYFVVQREVNGLAVRYIETMQQPFLDDIRDAFYVDCGLSYDDPVPISYVALDNPIVIHSEAHGFQNGDEVDIFDIEWDTVVDKLGNEAQPDQLNGYRFTVADATEDTFVIKTSKGDTLDGTTYKSYISGGTIRKAVSTVVGADHLEGRTIKALCDGNVVSNLVIDNGAIKLPRKFSRVHIGLQYTTDIETLDVEASNGTIQGHMKKISKVFLKIYNSRGFFVGPTKDALVEIKERTTEPYGDPTRIRTGDIEVIIPPSWNSNGRVFIRQVDPLPLTIVAIVPYFEVSDE